MPPRRGDACVARSARAGHRQTRARQASPLHQRNARHGRGRRRRRPYDRRESPMAWGYYDSYYPPYVSVAERRAKAAKEVAKLEKKGQKISPVKLDGKTI